MALAAPISSFIGREQEIEDIAGLLQQADVRLVTLTGPGGVGKTRLALQVIDHLKPAFPDGIVPVSLASIRDSGLVPGVIAQAFGVRESPDQPVVVQLADALRDQTALIMLDNFEQVVEAGPAIATLLASCPHMKVLVTSRVVLHLTGEHDILVGPLPLPGPGAQATVDAVPSGSAIQLFMHRAKAALSTIALTPDNVQIVVEICRRVDGLPLAIELAAARVTHMSLPALLARLEHSLPLLTGGARDQPARQQTMRQAIAWSYDLLNPDEQALLRRLSTFAGGFTLDAAEAISGGSQTDVLDAISSLADKSLLRIETRNGAEPRYLMLETVRQFVAERLEAEGEVDAARAAHAAYFTNIAESVAPRAGEGVTGHQLASLRADGANHRVALDWFNQRGDAEGLLRLTRALSPFWQNSGPWTEGIAWMERALAFDQPPSIPQIEVLLNLGASAGYQGNFAQAKAWLIQGHDAAVQLGATYAEAYALMILGSHLVDQGHFAEGEAVLITAQEKARQGNDPNAEWAVLAHLGVAAWGQGNIDEAKRRLERARVAGQGGEHRLAVGIACRYLGLIAAESGNTIEAAERFRERGNWDVDDEFALARLLADLAPLAIACGLHEQAAQISGAARTIDRMTRTLSACPERAAHDRAFARARDQLGDHAFRSAASAGEAMTHDEVTRLAETVLASAETPRTDSPAASGPPASQHFTPREREVLRLLVDGHSNTAIGELLFISGRTAQTHVTNILAKLGVTTRTEAAARAVRDGLI